MDDNRPSDEELLRRLYDNLLNPRGYNDALSQIVRRYGEKLIKTAANRLNWNFQDAEDVVVDVWCDFDKEIKTGEKIRKLEGWLVCVTRRKAIKLGEKTRRLNILRKLQLITEEQHEMIKDSKVADPSQQLKYEELREKLSSGSVQKDPNILSVFVFRVILEKRIDEIAEIFGITRTRVRYLLVKAKMLLRDKLNRYLNGD